MHINSAERVGPGYRFYAGDGFKTSFVSLPKEMVDEKSVENVEVDWNRVVAFGPMAELINDLKEQGVELFKIASGRIRNNNLKRSDGTIWESHEIVAEELVMKGFAKLLKEYEGKGMPTNELPDAV